MRDMGQVKSTVRTLNFRNADFPRTSWETALRDKGVEQSWQIFKDAFHRMQDLLMTRCKKSGKDSMAELRFAGQTKGQEENAQAVEAGTGILGRVKGCCLVV